MCALFAAGSLSLCRLMQSRTYILVNRLIPLSMEHGPVSSGLINDRVYFIIMLLILYYDTVNIPHATRHTPHTHLMEKHLKSTERLLCCLPMCAAGSVRHSDCTYYTIIGGHGGGGWWWRRRGAGRGSIITGKHRL